MSPSWLPPTVVLLSLLALASLGTRFVGWGGAPLSTITPAQAVASPPPDGKAIAEARCSQCHDLSIQNRPGLPGPTLWGVVGRAAAGKSDYDYSQPFRAAALERTLAWKKSKLEKFLADPKEFLPETAIVCPAIPDHEQRTALIKYLATITTTVESNSEVVNLPEPPTTKKELLAVGKEESNKCRACHDLSARRKIVVGPPLWGVINQPAAQQTGFNYSEGFLKNTGDLVWNDENLDRFLYNPQGFAPGTTMLFDGIQDPDRRKAVVGYLKTLH